jgi:hypothetical protein
MNHFARCCTERDCQGQNAVIIAACREDMEPTVPLNLYICRTSDFLMCAFAMPDTGAQDSVADSKLLDDLDMDLCDLDEPKHKEIVGIDGSDLHPVASITVDLELTGRRTTETITFCMDGISPATGPLRDILKTRNKYVSTGAHKKAMEEVKKTLTTTPILAPFDPGAETALETDASRKKGFG